MSDQAHRTAQGAQRYTVHAENPNPTDACACYPGGHGEDSGGPFVVWTATEPLEAPHMVTCANCVIGACRALAGERLGFEAPETNATPAEPVVEDPTHVNPVAETLAEAERLLAARELDHALGVESAEDIVI